MTDILLIEDDPELGELVRDFMIKEGFSVRLCADAETALVLLEGEECRVVLLDVMLPKMNGFETCTAIRSIRDIPILMITLKIILTLFITPVKSSVDSSGIY